MNFKMLARNTHPRTHDTKMSVFSPPPGTHVPFHSLLKGAACCFQSQANNDESLETAHPTPLSGSVSRVSQ